MDTSRKVIHNIRNMKKSVLNNPPGKTNTKQLFKSNFDSDYVPNPTSDADSRRKTDNKKNNHKSVMLNTKLLDGFGESGGKQRMGS